MQHIYYMLRRVTQRAYEIKGFGLGRICEFIRRWASRHAPVTPLLISDFRGDAKFRCFLREHMGGQIFFRGSYAGDQLAIIERILKDDSVFLDVGANQGEFSIAAARVAQRGKVIAFEPVAEYRDRLFENIKLNNFRNIEVIPVALGDKDCELPIYDSQNRHTDGTKNEGLTTLFCQSSRQDPRETVRVRRLDDVLNQLGISRVHVVELDVEGAEWIALRGAQNTITRDRPVLIVEINKATCQAAGYQAETFVEWLAGLNYRIEKIIEGGKTTAISSAFLDDFQNVIAYPR